MSAQPSYALVDWGTTSFRAWACAADGTVLGERRAPDGLTSVSDGAFAAVLERHLDALDVPPDAPAILCGMVGSRTGWVEAQYLAVPTGLADVAERASEVHGGARRIHILPGLANRSTAPDVMRGEETQLLGVVADGFDTGIVCMPGTHSKWVRLDAGSVTDFATFMTGELFQLLKTASTLRQAMETEAGQGAELAGFVEGFLSGFERSGELSNALFQLRAGWLLHGETPARQAARLSGILIGIEFAGAVARFGRPASAALLASGPIAELYEAAFKHAGISVERRFDADRCVRFGLNAAARLLHPDRSAS